MKKVVLFASGSGSNAEKIIKHFKNNTHVKVVAIFSNNPHAKVLDRADFFNIPKVVFDKEDLYSNDTVLDKINEIKPNLIVLAGFLLKFPESVLKNYPNSVINIHPALLPKYGGKGMYGMNIHKAVFDNKELETGITIHYVNENYDEGAIIFQKEVSVATCTSPEAVAQKVLALEHEYFPEVIEKLLIPKL
jgi:phosphoribosylglycinamide formyltransferase 1